MAGSEVMKCVTFSPEEFKQALAIAEQFHFVISKAKRPENPGWIACSIELPNCHGRGKTVEECIKNTLNSQASGVAILTQRQGTPPVPYENWRRLLKQHRG